MNEYQFLPMPLSDDEVIDRYVAIRTEITRLSSLRQPIQLELQKQIVRRENRIVNRFSKTGVGDGRDLLNVAPKTTAAIRDFNIDFARLERSLAMLQKERFYLEAWYPATLRKADLL